MATSSDVMFEEHPGTATHAAGERASVPVTVVMPVLNEELQIAEAIHAAAWADEVIVIDGGSSDRTVEIARACGATVLHKCGTTIAGQRNAGIEAARNAWIVALDADERATRELTQELSVIVRESAHDAYRVRFRNFYLGRELTRGRWGRESHVRVFRREHRFVERRVHESLETVPNVGSLHGCILHRPYRDLAHHLQKIIFYARLGAEDLDARGKRASLWHLAARPAWRFARDYVGYGSWRDGRFGFLMSALSAIAAFLKYATLYAISLRRETA